MNRNITQLVDISQKKERLIIGLMSGTSLDGLDVALCSFQGSGRDTIVKLLKFDTVPYTNEYLANVRKVFAKKIVDFEQVCILNAWIGTVHGQFVLDCLNKWKVSPSDVDIIASHGQTVFHAPKSFHGKAGFPNSTLQIGDGDHIAVKTGIITVSDFRQKHIAAGGEGAPLAIYGDYLIFSCRGQNRIMLNIGGIANFTYLPKDLDATKVFSTDCGPGNTLIDAFTLKNFNQPYDQDGNFAKNGKVNSLLLIELKRNSFFSTSFPKTTGPELFSVHYVQKAQETSGTTALSSYDLLSTLTQLTAETLAEAVRKCVSENSKEDPSSFTIYTSGGGSHNKWLMKTIQEILSEFAFDVTDTLEIPGDAKEAILFATLANQALCGEHINFGNRSSVPNVTMGKISFPN